MRSNEDRLVLTAFSICVAWGIMVVALAWSFDARVRTIQRNQIEQAKVIANKLNSLEREIKQMRKTMETKPILPDVRRTDDEAEVRR